MANVEVQLDVKAEYKQALAAIAMLGKALDAVQQRAKMALSVTGGAQGGANGANGAGKAEAEQKAAVEALSAAMRDAAAAAAMLAESVGKLTPVLEAMGPQAEQVQQVLTLAEHYKQLAAAMGIAADAAAKYNASGALQGETDERIRKLMEENQQLMELVSNIREEYAAIVRRNAELNRARAEREENTRAVKEEMEVTQDLSYVMQLAAMSKHELTAEIDRLTKACKEAAKAGDDSKYQELNEELKLARQAMQKLRQEQQLTKIMWLQEAQVAGQLAGQIKKVSEGIMGFGESLEEGTVDLAGMAEGVMSFASSIKAGLGPVGWLMLALEGLSAAINWYAKKQKEAEEAEKKRQERIVNLTTAYNEAATAVEAFKNQEARKTEINELIARYDDLNARLKERNDLQEKNLRMKQLELAMEAKDDAQQLSVKRHEIMRAYYYGEIDEEEMQSRLDHLKIEQARNKKKQIEKQNALNLDSANSQLKIAEERKRDASLEMSSIMSDERIYGESVTTMNMRAADYNLAQQTAQDAAEKYYKKLSELRAQLELARKSPSNTGANVYVAEQKLNEFLKGERDVKKLQEQAEAKKRLLNGWSIEQIESGEYETRLRDHETRKKTAEDNLRDAETKLAEAQESLTRTIEQNATNLRQQNQAIRYAITETGQQALTRDAKRKFEERNKKKREEEQAKKRAAEAARKEAERIKALQDAALAEGAYDGGMTKNARRLAKGDAWGFLSDSKLSMSELREMVNTMKAKGNAENESLRALFKAIIEFARQNKQVTAKTLGKMKQELEETQLSVF